MAYCTMAVMRNSDSEPPFSALLDIPPAGLWPPTGLTSSVMSRTVTSVSRYLHHVQHGICVTSHRALEFAPILDLLYRTWGLTM
jgi:hypothetical protein